MDEEDDFDLYGDALTVEADPTLGILPAEESKVVEEQQPTESVGPSSSTVPAGRNDAPEPAEQVPNVIPGHDAVYLSEMHWVKWTSDEDIKQAALSARVHIDYNDITFSEVKQNGKSRGMAFVDCHSAENAARIRNWFEANEFQNKRMMVQTASTANGNPYKPYSKDTRQVVIPGAPTGPRASRGGYVPRGRGVPSGPAGMGMRGGRGGGQMGMMMNMGMMNPMMIAQQQAGAGMMGMNMGMGMGMPHAQGQFNPAAFNPAFFGGYQDDQDGARKRQRGD